VRVPLEEPPLSPDMEEEEDDLGKTLAVSRFGDLISKPPAWDPEKPSRSYSERDFDVAALTAITFIATITVLTTGLVTRCHLMLDAVLDAVLGHHAIPRARVSRVAGEKSRPRSPSASYDLRERLRPGSALGSPGGPEQQVPTDEAEAQMLGSADLDDMKRAEASAIWGMMSPLEEATEPSGALSPGPGGAEGQSPQRAPAPSPRDSLASEDLEMFVLDLEDYDLWESIRGQLSPMVGGPASAGLEGADGEEGREALPESVWMCAHGGVHMGAEGHREGHRLEDNPGVRRHLVKKPSRTQGGRGSPSGLAPILRRKKKKQQLDRRPHEVPDPEEVSLWILLASPPPFSLPPCLAHRHVPRTAGPTWQSPGLHPWRPPQVFVELNELMLDRSQEPHWRETARWIKFEEDVEEETERWGKPHVASLSFHSLLELRRTIAHGRGPAGLGLELQALFTNHRARPVPGYPAPGTAPWSPGTRRGAALLDLEQTTLPGIAHLVVETMIVSDQIRPEDRASVLRTLLLKHSHPNDDKDSGFFPRNASSSSVNSVLGNHHPTPSHGPDGAVPTVADDLGEPAPLWPHDPEAKESPGLEQGVGGPAMASGLGPSPIPVLRPQKPLHMPGGDGHRGKSLKLLEKIPEDAEATVVLVGCVPFLEQPAAAFVRLNEAVLLESVLEVPVPVRFLFVMLGPGHTSTDYHELGRSIATLMSDKLFHDAAYQADDRQDLLSAISEFLDGSIVIPPSEVEGRDLLRSVAAFQRELLRKRREREQTKVEMTTQGGYVAPGKGEKTEGLMGVSELIVSTAVLGVLFSLLGAQPLLVVGFSGPLLVFEEAFFKFCRAQGLEYLTGRVWVGLWLVVFVLALVAAEGSFLVRYISPFTQEIFAFLISLIFIYETFHKLYKVFTEHPLLPFYPPAGALAAEPDLNGTALPPTEGPPGPRNQPNTALLSLILMLGTFLIAFFLRKFRNSRFLGGKARRIIGDFGIPISILVMVLVDYSITDTYTQKLTVPTGLSVTSPDKRTWFIPPLGSARPFPPWMMVAAAVPALLVLILIFMETQITAPIRPHGGCLRGHVGLSIVMGAVLRRIPLAVLFGIFLYMGVTSLSGIQLSQRLLLILMPAKHHPEQPYVTKVGPGGTEVKTWRMHLFTCIQLGCIALLWVVKSTAASLAFPFLLLLTLDSEDAEPNFDEDGQDEYNELHMPV
ncbi:hypothetical protein E2I00_003110, partial [Balaenoptera physalus]